MPKVGKKHFKYTEKGKKAAKAHAKKTDKKVENAKEYGLGGFLKGVAGSFKKAAKGSKAHREKTKKLDEGKGGKNWYPGKFAKKAVKGAVKKGKEIVKDVKAKKAKKAADKSWSKAVKSQKKSGGESLSSLVKQRGSLKKGTAEYASVQNKINKAYGVSKRHKASVSKAKAKSKPKLDVRHAVKGVAAKTKKAKTKIDVRDIVKQQKTKLDKAKAKEDYIGESVEMPKALTGFRKKDKAKPETKKTSPRFAPIKPYPPREDQGPKFQQGGITPVAQDPQQPQIQAPQGLSPEGVAPEMATPPEGGEAFSEGGKVSGMFNWPVTDARSRGKK